MKDLKKHPCRLEATWLFILSFVYIILPGRCWNRHCGWWGLQMLSAFLHSVVFFLLVVGKSTSLPCCRWWLVWCQAFTAALCCIVVWVAVSFGKLQPLSALTAFLGVRGTLQWQPEGFNKQQLFTVQYCKELNYLAIFFTAWKTSKLSPCWSSNVPWSNCSRWFGHLLMWVFVLACHFCLLSCFAVVLQHLLYHRKNCRNPSHEPPQGNIDGYCALLECLEPKAERVGDRDGETACCCWYPDVQGPGRSFYYVFLVFFHVRCTVCTVLYRYCSVLQTASGLHMVAMAAAGDRMMLMRCQRRV